MKSENIEKLVFEKLNLKAEPNSAGDLESYYLPLIVMLYVILFCDYVFYLSNIYRQVTK